MARYLFAQILIYNETLFLIPAISSVPRWRESRRVILINSYFKQERCSGSLVVVLNQG